MDNKPVSSSISYSDVNRDIFRTLTETGPLYWRTLALMLTITVLCLVFPWFYQMKMGLQTAGMNHPVVWGSYLANFIFWIGLSHSGTLLSAILHITHSDWRKAIYRSAEAMTLFSLMTAALFVFIHLGRVWYLHWTLPYPNPMGLWPNFRSPLLFDVTAIPTYLTASSVFLYIGSIPDFAAVRDMSSGWRYRFYRFLAMGWRGTHKEWFHHGHAYTFFAVLIIPLAVSVHSIVSWDFALSIVPAFHHTIFAPYFVVGAIYSGTAGIVTLMFVLRKYFALQAYIQLHHFDQLAKLLLLLSVMWSYINVLEVFNVFYGHTSAEMQALQFKLWGIYAPLYWWMIFSCAVVPLLLIAKSVRQSLIALLIISIIINTGMYTERFLIVVTGLSRQYLPDAWGVYYPSLLELSILIGSLSFFVSLFLIFVKLVPSVSLYEVKETLPLEAQS